ncbi:MAG TPA: GNAT family N-acetyltransferase [Hyphomonadaceae bacterium]|nr:GNAT family N-acetyltransferase [Hyphomonadaceae bacterium]
MADARPDLTITLEQAAKGGRYVSRMADKPDAEMTYTNAGDGVISIDHTLVPKEMGGMGVGKALVEFMVMDVRKRGLKIIPRCPFTRATLEKHKEWQDILRDPF